MRTECELWTGAVDAQGYGRSRRGLAHRVAWMDRFGPIPDGLQVDHACHNGTGCHLGSRCPHRRCIRVEHLQLVTSRVNNLLKLAPVGGEERILTHCLRGHPRVPGNTYYGRDGRRRCLPCRAEDQRRRQARRLRQDLERTGMVPLFG